MTSSRKQTFFGKNGTIDDTTDPTPAQLKRHNRYIREIERRRRIRAVCPWCTHTTTLDKFTKQTASHDTAKNVECPRCYQGMTVKTTRIFDEYGPDGYSRWFWEQIFKWKGYEKMDFDHVKSTVKRLGFNQTFWDIYWEFKNSGGGQTVHSLSEESRKLARTLFDSV